jgi:hypothetical protein
MNFRRIRVKKQKLQFLEDIQKIQQALVDKGFFATYEECDELWRMYSEEHWCAGWVVMNSLTTQEIFDAVRPYFDPIENFAVDTGKKL